MVAIPQRLPHDRRRTSSVLSDLHRQHKHERSRHKEKHAFARSRYEWRELKHWQYSNHMRFSNSCYTMYAYALKIYRV